MLATGRRFEEVQALTRTWLRHVTRSGIVYYRFTFYEGWRAKAQNDDGWCPEDIILFPIDQGPDLPDLSHLCPVRAFQVFWEKRQFLGDPSYLWLKSEPVVLSHAVVRVIQQAVHLANPTVPAEEVRCGTHNLRKFAFSLAYIYFECPDLQILCLSTGQFFPLISPMKLQLLFGRKSKLKIR